MTELGDVSQVVVKTTTSNILIANATIENATQINTTTDNITIQHVDAQSLTAETTTGRITCENATIANRIKTKTTVGRISIIQTNAQATDIICNATTSSINGSGVTQLKWNLKIELLFNGNPIEYNVYLRTTTGSMSFQSIKMNVKQFETKPFEATKTINLVITNGNITLSIQS